MRVTRGQLHRIIRETMEEMGGMSPSGRTGDRSLVGKEVEVTLGPSWPGGLGGLTLIGMGAQDINMGEIIEIKGHDPRYVAAAEVAYARHVSKRPEAAPKMRYEFEELMHAGIAPSIDGISRVTIRSVGGGPLRHER